MYSRHSGEVVEAFAVDAEAVDVVLTLADLKSR
jgi:hypothetical protein